MEKIFERGENQKGEREEKEALMAPIVLLGMPEELSEDEKIREMKSLF